MTIEHLTPEQVLALPEDQLREYAAAGGDVGIIFSQGSERHDGSDDTVADPETGERMRQKGIRLPTLLIEKVESLAGDREFSAWVREAIEQRLSRLELLDEKTEAQQALSVLVRFVQHQAQRAA